MNLKPKITYQIWPLPHKDAYEIIEFKSYPFTRKLKEIRKWRVDGLELLIKSVHPFSTKRWDEEKSSVLKAVLQGKIGKQTFPEERQWE